MGIEQYICPKCKMRMPPNAKERHICAIDTITKPYIRHPKFSRQVVAAIELAYYRGVRVGETENEQLQAFAEFVINSIALTNDGYVFTNSAGNLRAAADQVLKKGK